MQLSVCIGIIICVAVATVESCGCCCGGGSHHHRGFGLFGGGGCGCGGRSSGEDSGEGGLSGGIKIGGGIGGGCHGGIGGGIGGGIKIGGGFGGRSHEGIGGGIKIGGGFGGRSHEGIGGGIKIGGGFGGGSHEGIGGGIKIGGGFGGGSHEGIGGGIKIGLGIGGRPVGGNGGCHVGFGHPACGHPNCFLGSIFGAIGQGLHNIFGGCRWHTHGQNQGSLCIALPSRPPPITGAEGPVSWKTIWVGNIRYIVFTYKGVEAKYKLPIGDDHKIIAFLALFKLTHHCQSPAVTVQTMDIVGSMGPVYWHVQHGKVTFYFKRIVGGVLKVIKQKSYAIKDGSYKEIMSLLGKFKISINFDQLQDSESSSDGAHITYTSNFANGNGKIVLFYKYYKDGQLVSQLSKEYVLKTNTDAEINAIIAKFQIYCKENTHYSVVTTKPITGNIDWKTEYRNGQQYMIATYTEKQGDKVLRTVKKEYKIEDNSQATVQKYIEQFKADLKSGAAQ